MGLGPISYGVGVGGVVGWGLHRIIARSSSSSVLILNGRCRGSSATLLAIDERNFNVSARPTKSHHQPLPPHLHARASPPICNPLLEACPFRSFSSPSPLPLALFLHPALPLPSVFLVPLPPSHPPARIYSHIRMRHTHTSPHFITGQG